MTAKKALLLPPPPCATTCVATPSTSAAVATAPTMTYRLRMTPPSGRLGGDTQESWSGFRNRRACEHERTTALNGDRSGPRFACAAWAPRPRVSDPHGGTRRRHRRGRAGQDAQRARIEFHEQQRGEYTNVYLDKVEPAPAEAGDDSDPEEAAWRTAVDAAPWLVGESDPHEAVPPDELYDKLKPFKERVAEDIRDN